MDATFVIEREQCDYGREIVVGDNLTIEVSRQGAKYRIRITGGEGIGSELARVRKVRSRTKRRKD